MLRLRDRKTADRILSRLREMDLDLTLMHVCGTHQDTLVRFGLQELLEDVGVEVRQGPGCPVCVITQKEMEVMAAFAREGKTIAVFGDLSRVPVSQGRLRDAGDVKVVYSINDAVDIAAGGREVIFCAIGFETTSPSTAAVLKRGVPEGFYIYSTHRVVPPALKALLGMGELKIDGIIEPGHVSTIIGSEPYQFISREFGVPQVIAGFEPLDFLMGVYMIAKQIEEGRAEVEIEYSRVVRPGGNTRALKLMDEVFRPVDVPWRGFPTIPGSGHGLAEEYSEHDASLVFEDTVDSVGEVDEPRGCRCGEVLRGVIESSECPLFGKACTPEHPVGPCMVSVEGSCQILYRYRKLR